MDTVKEKAIRAETVHCVYSLSPWKKLHSRYATADFVFGKIWARVMKEKMLKEDEPTST